MYCIGNKVYKRVNKEGVREPKRWFKRGKSKWQGKYIVQCVYSSNKVVKVQDKMIVKEVRR